LCVLPLASLVAHSARGFAGRLPRGLAFPAAPIHERPLQGCAAQGFDVLLHPTASLPCSTRILPQPTPIGKGHFFFRPGAGLWALYAELKYTKMVKDGPHDQSRQRNGKENQGKEYI